MAQKFTYETSIREHHLDSFGHVNNATYLEILEEARWEWITQGGYGHAEALASGMGPVLLEVKITFRKELALREQIKIVCWCSANRGRIHYISQEIYNRAGELCTTAEIKGALFDLTARKIINPTEKFKASIGLT